MRSLTVSLLCLVCACQSSAQVRANGSASAKADPFAALDEPEPVDPPPTSAGLDSVDETLAQTGGTHLALLGARHDLTLEIGLASNCRCVAFATGAPTDPRFQWEGPTPRVQHEAQVVVAFRADSDCLDGAARPSYRGYETEGANVVLLLEAARSGRPELSGAIVPRPKSGGQLLVRPTGKLGYGGSLEGEGDCDLGLANADAPTTGRTPSLRTVKPVATDVEQPPPDSLHTEE